MHTFAVSDTRGDEVELETLFGVVVACLVEVVRVVVDAFVATVVSALPIEITRMAHSAKMFLNTIVQLRSLYYVVLHAGRQHQFLSPNHKQASFFCHQENIML